MGLSICCPAVTDPSGIWIDSRAWEELFYLFTVFSCITLKACMAIDRATESIFWGLTSKGGEHLHLSLSCAEIAEMPLQMRLPGTLEKVCEQLHPGILRDYHHYSHAPAGLPQPPPSLHEWKWELRSLNKQFSFPCRWLKLPWCNDCQSEETDHHPSCPHFIKASCCANFWVTGKITEV